MNTIMNDKNALPLVSIFVTFFNQRDFVDIVLTSLINQTYKNIEICIWDDCSTDWTQEKLREWQLTYPDIIKVIYNEKNLWITWNCNEILNICKWKYITFCWWDDQFLPEKVEKQVKVMEDDDSIVFSHWWVIYYDLIKNQETNKIYLPNVNKITYFRDIIKLWSFFHAVTVMIRRDAIRYDFNKMVPIWSDWLFFLQNAYSWGKIYFINEILSKYWRHENNSTKLISKENRLYEQLTILNIVLVDKPDCYKEVNYNLSKIFDNYWWEYIYKVKKDKKNAILYLYLSIKYKYRFSNIIKFLILKMWIYWILNKYWFIKHSN